MKKLMILAAVAAMVATAKAETTYEYTLNVNSGAKTVYAASSTALFTGNMYFIGTEGTKGNLANDLKTAYKAGTKEAPFDLAAFVKGIEGAYLAVTVAEVKDGAIVGLKDDALKLAFDGDEITKVMPIFEVLKGDGTTLLYASSFTTLESQKASFSNTTTSSGTQWAAGEPMIAPIPEPTSGLLLLLGVAGLALRRKRA